MLWSWSGSCGSNPHCCLGMPQVAILLLSTPGAMQRADRCVCISGHVLNAYWMALGFENYHSRGVHVFRNTLGFQQAIPSLRFSREELQGRQDTRWVFPDDYGAGGPPPLQAPHPACHLGEVTFPALAVFFPSPRRCPVIPSPSPHALSISALVGLSLERKRTET